MLKNLRSLLILGVFASNSFVASGAEAKMDPACFPESRIARELSQFRINFKGSAYKHCDLENSPYRFVKAILFIKDISDRPFDGSNIYSPEVRIGSSPWRFFSERVKEINIDSESLNCKQLNGGWARLGSGIINVCEKNAYMKKLSGPAQLLMHEATHAEAGGTHAAERSHTPCKRSSYTNPDPHGACDRSMGMGGAYAVETEFAIGVSRIATLPEDIRNAFRELAIRNLRTRFVNLSADLKDHVALVRTNGRVDLYDGTKIIPYAQSIPSGTYPSVDDFFGLNVQNLLPKLKKYIHGMQVSCGLYKTEVVCSPHGQPKVRYAIPIDKKYTAVNLVDFEAADKFFGAGSGREIFIVTREGKLLGVPGSYERYLERRGFDGVYDTDAIALTTWRTYKLRPYLLKLKSNGRVYIEEYGRDEVEAPGANTSPVKDIIGPFVWGPSLDTL